MVSPADDQTVEAAWTHNADAIVLDLHRAPRCAKGTARLRLREQLPLLRKGGAEAFVSVSRRHLFADLDAAVWPGLDGVVLCHGETAQDIREADAVLGQLERIRGIDVGRIELVVRLGTARGIWNIREVLTASPRVTSAGLDEPCLVRDLNLPVLPGEDPFAYYARPRLIMEAAGLDEALHGHHGVYRVGFCYPMSLFPKADAPLEEVLSAAQEAKEFGFSGAFCIHRSWIEPCNRGFSPTDAQVAYHRAVRKSYAEGLAQGRGAVQFVDGRFIERPFDELAKKILALRDLCDQRDAEKEAARSGTFQRTGARGTGTGNTSR